MYYVNHYVIDWDKVRDVQDLKRILMALQIAFEPDCPTLDLVRDFVDLKPKRSAFVPKEGKEKP